jgi:hypothetical protein
MRDTKFYLLVVQNINNRYLEPLALVILHWEMENMIFGKRLIAHVLHYGLHYVQFKRCCVTASTRPSQISSSTSLVH